MVSMATNRRHRVHVGGLRQRLGQRLEIDISEAFPGLQVIASRTTERPVTGTLTIESIERGVSVTGNLHVPWEADCRRCLEPVVGESQPFVDEVFQVNAPENSDIIDFDGDTVELDDVLRETAMASLPLSPLCGPDCLGPDPERFPPGVNGLDPNEIDEMAVEASNGAVLADPRWAVLDQLDLN